MSAETAKVLRDAAELIREKGWCQGDYEKADGAHCAIGAIGCSSIPAEQFFDARSALQDAVDQVPVWRWNDTPGRTVDEVLAAFEAAAQAEEAKP
jgi:hypothetical protein